MDILDGNPSLCSLGPPSLPHSVDVTNGGSQLNYVDLHYLCVHDGEEVAEWRDAALVDEVADLVGRPARAGVGDRPGSLLSRAVEGKYALKYFKTSLGAILK